MRIVSGKFGGRKLFVPAGDNVRPTSDKVRGAIFNALQSRGVVHEAKVIDCFAGTGALGLEAISQGASTCLFIDKNSGSLDLAKKNAASLELGKNVAFMLKDAAALKVRPENIKPFTLAFLDPPYGSDLVEDTLDLLNIRDWLAPAAICVVEVEKDYNSGLPKFYTLLDERIYGDTKLFFLRYEMMPE